MTILETAPSSATRNTAFSVSTVPTTASTKRVLFFNVTGSPTLYKPPIQLAQDWLSRTEWLTPQTGGEPHLTNRPVRIAPWVAYISRRLKKLADRAPGEAPPIPSEILAETWKEALRTLPARCPTPSVVPSEEGGVDLVWHKGGWDVEMSIEPDARYIWARNRFTGEMWDGTLEEHRRKLSGLLDSLSQK